MVRIEQPRLKTLPCDALPGRIRIRNGRGADITNKASATSGKWDWRWRMLCMKERSRNAASQVTGLPGRNQSRGPLSPRSAKLLRHLAAVGTDTPASRAASIRILLMTANLAASSGEHSGQSEWSADLSVLASCAWQTVSVSRARFLYLYERGK